MDLNKLIYLVQYGGMRGVVHADRQYGQRPVQVSGLFATLEEQIWPGLHTHRQGEGHEHRVLIDRIVDVDVFVSGGIRRQDVVDAAGFDAAPQSPHAASAHGFRPWWIHSIPLGQRQIE